MNSSPRKAYRHHPANCFTARTKQEHTEDGIGDSDIFKDALKSVSAHHRWRLISLCVALLCMLGSCALGKPTLYWQHFSFNTFHDSPDMEVLDYRYGDCKYAVACPDKRRVAMGDSLGATNVGVCYPRPESLYVKWRSKITGNVYEDTVDLTKRLPHDMTDCRVRFVVSEAQLYIYLFRPPDRNPSGYLKNTLNPRTASIWRNHLIYPDNPTTQPYQIHGEPKNK